MHTQEVVDSARVLQLGSGHRVELYVIYSASESSKADSIERNIFKSRRRGGIDFVRARLESRVRIEAYLIILARISILT
jgi:hypothetical protein